MMLATRALSVRVSSAIEYQINNTEMFIFIGCVISGFVLAYGVWAYFSGKVYVHYGNYTKKDHSLLFHLYVSIYIFIPIIFYILLLSIWIIS